MDGLLPTNEAGFMKEYWEEMSGILVGLYVSWERRVMAWCRELEPAIIAGGWREEPQI